MGVKSYVVFSNKGGTGKTTLAFQLAAEYARQNEHYKVVVIDLCPQANVSQTLLSKTQKYPLRSQPGKLYVSEASKLLKEVDSGKEYEKTVCGYLMAMLDEEDSQIGKLDCKKFLIKVHRYNRDIPENVFLLCGDRYLDVLSKRLEQERQLSPTRHDDYPWKRVTLFIKYFIDTLSYDPYWRRSCFVIDTNSNFSIYTEMAISAAKNLIVPFTADDFSLSAIETMLYMVYGYESKEDKDERLKNFKESQYFWLAKKNEIECSKLLFFVFNRVTFYESKAANAFDAFRDRLIYILKQVLNSRRSRKIFGFSPDLWDDEILQERYIVDVHDFHSTGIVSLHSGCPMSEVKIGDHLVYGSTCKVNISWVQKSTYYDDIDKILQKMS